MNKPLEIISCLLLFVMPMSAQTDVEKDKDVSPFQWYVMGADHYEDLQFDKALMCFENACDGFCRLGRKPEMLILLKHIGFIQRYTDNTIAALATYEEALYLATELGSDDSIMELAKELYNLNLVLGNMERVESYSRMMDSLIESTTDSQAKYEYYIHKGKEARNQRYYNLAEQWFLKARAIAENMEPEDDRDVNLFVVYLQLRDLYHNAKRYDEAIEYASKTLDGSSESWGILANIYSEIGDREKCNECLDSLFVEEHRINEPRKHNRLYVIRGNCRMTLKEYQEALDDFKKADAILATKYFKYDSERATVYALMGGAEYKLKHYKEAEQCYASYADAIRSLFGENSLDYINAQIYLANANGFAGHIEEGCTEYTSAVEKLKDIIRNRLPYMNKTEREAFWRPLSAVFTRMTPYALKAERYNSDFTKTCYDAILMSKSFLLESERSLYDVIKKEGNAEDLNQYMQISSMRNKIKKWERKIDVYADSVLDATKIVSSLERELFQKYKSSGKITSFIDIDYDSVQKTLGRNDVLVDFTDFISDTEGRCYAAYIVKKKQRYPMLKKLFAESQIDSLGIVRPDMFYDVDFATDVIRLLWEPIKNYVSEGATVYYVPSQLLFQISPESLPLEDGTLLGDHYNFVRLSSARELVKKSNSKYNRSTHASAALYGGLQYDVDPKQMSRNSKMYNLNLLTRDWDPVRGNTAFDELPGAELEIEEISSILNRANCNVVKYMGMQGTEESFLNMHRQSPDILHLATHGFYYTPSEAEKIDYLKGYTDAMSLSGLIMAGGNAAWQGRELPKNVLGGVLTASNIALIDLTGTDMVVLSACQTGQGVATAEGLYGLQRAFKKAGCETIIMTLWSVSDKVTKDFMVRFYELLADSGWNKSEAFKAARSEIRKKYPDPYHWAAFIMLD